MIGRVFSSPKLSEIVVWLLLFAVIVTWLLVPWFLLKVKASPYKSLEFATKLTTGAVLSITFIVLVAGLFAPLPSVSIAIYLIINIAGFSGVPIALGLRFVMLSNKLLKSVPK